MEWPAVAVNAAVLYGAPEESAVDEAEDEPATAADISTGGTPPTASTHPTLPASLSTQLPTVHGAMQVQAVPSSTTPAFATGEPSQAATGTASRGRPLTKGGSPAGSSRDSSLAVRTQRKGSKKPSPYREQKALEQRRARAVADIARRKDAKAAGPLEYGPQQWQVNKYSELEAIAIDTDIEADFAPATRAFIGTNVPDGTYATEADKQCTMKYARDHNFQEIEWDGMCVCGVVQHCRQLKQFGSTRKALVDRNDVILAILAGRPADAGWDGVIGSAEAALKTAGEKIRKTKSNPRGPFKAVSVGMSFGGGQKVRGCSLGVRCFR